MTADNCSKSLKCIVHLKKIQKYLLAPSHVPQIATFSEKPLTILTINLTLLKVHETDSEIMRHSHATNCLAKLHLNSFVWICKELHTR